MGSHKHKKKYSNSSSSESEAESSSSDSGGKSKKYPKKSKHSSSDESEEEKSKKSKMRKISDEIEKEKLKKQRKRIHDSEEKNSEPKAKEKDHHHEKYKEEKSEERYKVRYKSADRDRSRDRGRSRDRDLDESRNRREHNNRERYEDRDRGRRQDNRKDDRRSFRDHGNSREHRFDDGDYRNRNRGENRRDNYRRGNRGRRSNSFDHANAKWGKNDSDESKPTKREQQQKEKPNFGLSGKLTEETNAYKGVVIKYSEPPEARKPRRRWRLYPFKGEKALQTLYIHRESAYLIGRERKVVDLPVDHPSCSKQHAALQYRLVPFTREDGSSGKRVRPYIIDLESANGTFINNKKIEEKKFVELFEKDVIKFGFSSREYVLLHENSKDEAMDDDVKQEEEEIPVKEEPQ